MKQEPPTGGSCNLWRAKPFSHKGLIQDRCRRIPFLKDHFSVSRTTGSSSYRCI